MKKNNLVKGYVLVILSAFLFGCMPLITTYIYKQGINRESVVLLRNLLAPYVGKLDAVVLGCTHYPLAAEDIAGVLGESVVLLDGGEGTARETRRRLRDAGLLEEGEGKLIMENSRGIRR